MSRVLWTRDELILVLDLYFNMNVKASNDKTPVVVALSKLLRAAPINGNHILSSEFRNSAGVYAKLSRFLRLDPQGEGKSIGSPSPLQRQVWSDFAHDKAHLRETAASIRAAFESDEKEIRPFPDDDIDDAAEGKILTRLHRIRERNPALVQKKKLEALSKGPLTCEVCEFDFKSQYGDLGDGFIECHHRAPLSTLRPGQKTRLTDLALVCANCHRMLHRGRRWLSIEDLKKRLAVRV